MSPSSGNSIVVIEETLMKRIGYMLVAVIGLIGGIAYISLPPANADGQAAAGFDVKLPSGYRDWRLISVAHEAGNLNDLRGF